MVKEKLNSIKRFFLIYLTHFLLNLKVNDKYLFAILLYIFLTVICLLFGVWSFFGVSWHIFIILLQFLSLLALLLKFIKNFKYHNRKKTLLWIERNSFKFTTPLTSMEDLPANANYNPYVWYLHQMSIKKSLKNLNFLIPNISLSKYDPLNIRFLLSLFFFLAIFWSYKNNKIYENLLGWTNFGVYLNQDSYFDLKVWYSPPKYTSLEEKLIPIIKKEQPIKVQEHLPINSELKVFIKSNKKNFSIKENGIPLELKKNNKDNYEWIGLVQNNKNIVLYHENKEYATFKLFTVEDKKPKIEIVSAPNIVNETSLSFISRVTDDYGIKKINLNIKKPPVFKHFEEEFITYNLFLSKENHQNNKLVENYFYKYLADIVWASSNTYLEIKAIDHYNHITNFSASIKLPSKNFENTVAIKIYKIRESLAKNKINKNGGEKQLRKIFDRNQDLLNDRNINVLYNEILALFNSSESIRFSLKNELFKKLFSLAEIVNEGDFYLAKKNLEEVEQNLFDSIKQKDSAKVSTDIENFKEKVKSLLNLENEENNNNLRDFNNKNLRNQIEELTQQIEDLLKSGTKDGVNEKMQKLQQLSESIKNPNENSALEEKLKQKKDFINKLSDLLNEQEKIMEETFNRAAERGKFEQSSEGSGGKSPKEKQEELRNTLGNVIREIGASENEIPQDLGRADRAMRQASRDLDNGRPDEASNAQARAVEMIQRSINKINSKEYMLNYPQIAEKGEEKNNKVEKEYLAENQNIEYDGTASGGTVSLSREQKIKNASKIANELYNRYNEEDRSLKDKQHIKKLLDWY